MRHVVILMVGLVAFALSPAAFAEESDEESQPGADFDLYGALDTFSKAESVEDFEKQINSEDNDLNNLDLNEDGDVDYVQVVEKVEGATHVFILRALLGEDESQDIATIDLEKSGEDDISAQAVGDETLYGKDFIIEPGDSASSFRLKHGRAVRVASADGAWPGFTGSAHELESLGWEEAAGEPLEVAAVVVVGWPIVRVVFAPLYRPWVSPYRWARYPVWWRPWRPVARATFHRRRVAHRRHHYHHYHRSAHRHSTTARNVSRANHHSSATFQNKAKASSGRASGYPKAGTPGTADRATAKPQATQQKATQQKAAPKTGTAAQPQRSNQPSTTGRSPSSSQQRGATHGRGGGSSGRGGAAPRGGGAPRGRR